MVSGKQNDHECLKKTKVMLIATRRKLASLKKTSVDLFINGYELENVSEQMLLGLTITNDLKWNKNVDLLCKKISNGIIVLRKLKTFLDIPTRTLFFNAYILPYFDYCCTIWGHASSEIKTLMLKLQKKCARYILDADISHPLQTIEMATF